MKTFSLSLSIAICSILFLGCNYGSDSNRAPKSLLPSIKKQKSIVDYKLIHDQKTFILFAQIDSNSIPVKVENHNWPDDVSYSYDILKNPAGKVIAVLAGPTSESGDWDISYIHYFNSSGNTIAFERRTNFFNSECTDDVAYEIVTKYYDTDFQIIGQAYKLTDKKGKELKASKCTFPYDFTDYRIYKNVSECLAGYNIKLN